MPDLSFLQPTKDKKETIELRLIVVLLLAIAVNCHRQNVLSAEVAKYFRRPQKRTFFSIIMPSLSPKEYLFNLSC